MNQGKLEVVKQEMARVNINILGISELNGREWANLIQMTHIYYFKNNQVKSRRLNQTILKEISPEYSLEGLTLKLKLQYLAT